MALFIGIVIALVIVNLLLLVISASLRSSTGSMESREKIKAPKSEVYPLKVSDSNYQEAV